MGLIDMVIVPTCMLPLEDWEMELLEGVATVQLFSLDLWMESKVFWHEYFQLHTDGMAVRRDRVRAFASPSEQGWRFPNLDATAGLLEGYFTLHYDENFTLCNVARQETDY